MTRPDPMPIDPDVDPDEDARHHPGAALFAPQPRTRWPRFRGGVLAVVFAGGCIGGLTRYLVVEHWSEPRWGIPWATFTVNVVGAFVLALLVVVVTDVLGPSTYLRPLVGTGFCGALTTFSSVVVAADRLIAHGHAGAAVTYLVLTLAVGLAAGAVGMTLGRSFAAYRRRSAGRGAS